MTRNTLIQNTLSNLGKLPDTNLKEVSDFTEFLLIRFEKGIVTEGIKKLVSGSKAFQFLEQEEDLYSESDIKEKYQ